MNLIEFGYVNDPTWGLFEMLVAVNRSGTEATIVLDLIADEQPPVTIKANPISPKSPEQEEQIKIRKRK